MERKIYLMHILGMRIEYIHEKCWVPINVGRYEILLDIKTQYRYLYRYKELISIKNSIFKTMSILQSIYLENLDIFN